MSSIFAIYAITLFVLFGLYLLGFLLNIGSKSNKNKFNLHDIAVVIPFRNEAHNLPKLLASISKLKAFPAEFIFVNDHSEDASLEILKTANVSLEILHLEAGNEGKKVALHKGISHAKTVHVLTWDADVEVSKNYFTTLSQTAKTDMLILPVKMKAKNFLGFFAALDYYFINALSFALTPFSKPIVASGANLLFEKKLYLEFYENSSSTQFSSGDDMFLLKAFKEKGYEIKTLLHSDLTLETDCPVSFKIFLHQRLRWIGKTSRVGDKFANFIGLFGILYQISFVVMLILIKPFWLILVYKLGFELLFFLPYLFKIRALKTLILSPIFSLLYPVYMLFIALAVLFVKVEWKGREVVS